MASNDQEDNLLFEGLLKDIGKYLECAICFQIFTDPVTLHCGHSYCMKCLDNYLSNSDEKKCPECREKIRPFSKRHKNVTLCKIVKVRADHKSFVSKEYPNENEMDVKLKHGDAVEYATVDSQEMDINRPEFVNTPVINDRSSEEFNDRGPDVPPTHYNTVQELAISHLSNDRQVEEGLSTQSPPPPHPLPSSSFYPLTFNPALGHRRLDFLLEEKMVVTKNASSSSNYDRFDISQWMAEQEFRDGCYYWDVDTSRSVGWAVGVAYPSIGRRDQLGRTASSWCLEWSRDKLCYWHNNMEQFVKQDYPSMVRVALDMTNGTLSFYSLSESLKQLHFVEHRFSAPVRPMFWLFGLKQHNALSFPPLGLGSV